MGNAKPILDVTETPFGLEYSVHGAHAPGAAVCSRKQSQVANVLRPTPPLLHSLSAASQGRDRGGVPRRRL